MAQFAPIDYGPQTSPDLSGIRSAEAATQEHGQRLLSAEQGLGQAGETAAAVFTQNGLHRQALQATAEAAQGTEKALKVIEDNPYYITKDTLTAAGLSSGKIDQLWNTAKAKNLVMTDNDGNETAATHAIGHDLFIELAKASREAAAQKISLPGWRAEFLKTAEVEALNKQERYLDPKLGRMGVEFDQAQSMTSWRATAQAARTPEDFRPILAGIKGSPTFSPDQKLAMLHHYGKLQDTVIADKALTNPLANEDDLKTQLQQLRGPNAALLYPNSDAKDRLELEHHVQAGIHFAQMQRDHDAAMQMKADKNSDDNLNAGVMRDVLSGKLDSTNLFAKPGQPDTGRADSLLSSLKTREGVENFYHFIESYNKNAKADTKQDKPGVFQALSTLYAHDLDGFRQAFESKGVVRIPGWENLGGINLATDLSPESYKHWAEKYTGLADKEASKEDSTNEGHFQTRLGAAVMNADGGRVAASDWTSPQWRAEHTDMEEFVTAQLKEAQVTNLRKTGHRLSVSDEYKTMLLAAKNYADNPSPTRYGRFFGGDDSGLGIETRDGTRKLGALERSYMTNARRAAGEVGTLDIQKEGAEFYDSYKAPIETVWKSRFGAAPDLEDTWNLYYLAKNLPGNADTQTRVLNAVDLAAQAATGKKKGGTK